MPTQVEFTFPSGANMLALDADTAIEITNAVDQAIAEVFSTMASHPAEQISLCSLPNHDSGQDACESQSVEYLTVTLSLDGELQGTMGICLPCDCALEWTESLLQEKREHIDQDVIDACGELGNMVVGGAKRRLGDLGLKMGLPNVIRAGREAIEFPTGVHPINLKYRFADATFDVFVALASH